MIFGDVGAGALDRAFGCRARAGAVSAQIDGDHLVA